MENYLDQFQKEGPGGQIPAAGRNSLLLTIGLLLNRRILRIDQYPEADVFSLLTVLQRL